MFKILLGFNFFCFRWLLRCSECFLYQRMCGGRDEERILRSGALALFDFSETVSDFPWTLDIFLFIWCCCLGTKSCSTICDPMDWSPPGSSVHRIFQARIPEWVAMPSSRGFSWPRGQNCSLCYLLLKVTRRKTCSLFSFLIRSLCLSLHDDWTLPWLERREVDNAPCICSNLSAGCALLLALLSGGLELPACAQKKWRESPASLICPKPCLVVFNTSLQALTWNGEEGVTYLTMSSVFLSSTHPWGSQLLPCAINILPRSQPICSLFLQSLVKAEVQTTNL